MAKGRKNKVEAFARFAELLAGPGPQQPAGRYSVADLIGEFEGLASGRVKPGTLTAYRCVLKPFVAAFGGRLPGELPPGLVCE